MSPTSLKNLQEEIRVLSNLPASDHIIRLHETIKTKNHFYLIVDYCNGGDLESVLEQRLLLSEKEVQIIFRQVLKAIKVMRDLKVIHRDIKNANILLHFPNQDTVNKRQQYTQSNLAKEEVVEVKLADFGFSQILKDGEFASVQCGTPLHMAPEILNGHPYNYKADMYSLGVSMFEALMGVTPFFGSDKKDLTRNVNTGLIRIPTNIEISNCCLDFQIKCLLFDSSERMSIDHALNHPFMNPDSPQYMETISMKPLVPSKTCSHLTTFNISMKPSFSYFGGNLVGGLLGGLENQDKYQFLDVHSGKILDEENLLKAQECNAQRIQDSYEEQAKKRSSELRAGQYFNSNEATPSFQAQDFSKIENKTSGQMEIESSRVGNEVQSKGSKKDVLQFRDIKAKISKHLLEDKIQRRKTLELLYQKGLKPQDLETDGSFSYLSNEELQSLRHIIQQSGNSPCFMGIEDVALQNQFIKELLGFGNYELPNLQILEQKNHPQNQSPHLNGGLLEVTDEESFSSSSGEEEEKQLLSGNIKAHSEAEKPNTIKEIGKKVMNFQRKQSQIIESKSVKHSFENQNSDITFQRARAEPATSNNYQKERSVVTLQPKLSSEAEVKQSRMGVFNYNPNSPVPPNQSKNKHEPTHLYFQNIENSNNQSREHQIINVFNNLDSSPINNKQQQYKSIRQNSGELDDQEELKQYDSLEEEEDQAEFHPSLCEEDQEGLKCDLIGSKENSPNHQNNSNNFEQNDNPIIGKNVEVSDTEALVASERRQVRNVAFRTDAMIMKMRSRLIDNKNQSKDQLHQTGTYLFGSSLFHNESREFKVHKSLLS